VSFPTRLANTSSPEHAATNKALLQSPPRCFLERQAPEGVSESPVFWTHGIIYICGGIRLRLPFETVDARSGARLVRHSEKGARQSGALFAPHVRLFISPREGRSHFLPMACRSSAITAASANVECARHRSASSANRRRECGATRLTRISTWWSCLQKSDGSRFMWCGWADSSCGFPPPSARSLRSESSSLLTLGMAERLRHIRPGSRLQPRGTHRPVRKLRPVGEGSAGLRYTPLDPASPHRQKSNDRESLALDVQTGTAPPPERPAPRESSSSARGGFREARQARLGIRSR
jgi:hypothetical protein